MRAPSLVALALTAGCLSNPDPRGISLQQMQRQGYGGWIIVERAAAPIVEGELLAIDRDRVHVKHPMGRNLFAIPVHEITGAELFTYESDSGFGAWGALGVLSTPSHGFFLVFSVPIWVASASIVAAVESRHVQLRYPQERLEEFAKWARFPQGMPRDLDVPRVDPRALAWELTKEAAAAARSGDCAKVKLLAPEVHELDADFHDVVFARDVAIRACLDLPAPPPTSTPPMP